MFLFLTRVITFLTFEVQLKRVITLERVITIFAILTIFLLSSTFRVFCTYFFRNFVHFLVNFRNFHKLCSKLITKRRSAQRRLQMLTSILLIYFLFLCQEVRACAIAMNPHDGGAPRGADRKYCKLISQVKSFELGAVDFRSTWGRFGFKSGHFS